MQIIRVDAFGPAENLKVVEMESPPLQAGEVRIAASACGVNRADVLQRTGAYHGAKVMPVFPGREAAGTVAEVGPGVSGFAVGDRVLGFGGRPGCYASEVNFPVERLVRIPDGVSFEQAACLPTSWLSAWYTLVRLARLQQGETVLIQGAASAVGHAAVLIARWRGARPIATAGSAEKLEWLRGLGAADGIDYSREDVAARVAELTGGKGCEVVLDAVGGKAFGASLKALAYGGRCVSMANVTTEDSVVNTRDFYPKNAAIYGFQISFLREKSGWDARPDLAELLALIASGALRPHVDRTFPLADAAGAHRWLEERRNRGNVLLVTGR
jgi:NADPH2:quinone reductase